MKKGTKFSLFSLLVIAGLVLAACGGAAADPVATEVSQPEPTEVPVEPTAEPEMEEAEEEIEEMEEAEPTVVDVAVSNEDFSTLVAAVQAAGLVETLSGEGPFTVFAPTNAAFEAALADLGMTADELLADTELLTKVLTYHVVAGDLMAADVLEQNLLETVEGSFALAYAGEEGAFINQAEIVSTDIEASNGVVHVIDAVILPPTYESEAESSIVDVAVSDEQFSTLVAAVTEAGLAETLSERGPFTVFAPTNAAFEAAFEALGITAEDLLADQELLTDILLYHVSLGALDAEAVTGRASLPMLNGDVASIEIREGNAYIDDAQIVATDIEASNGIVHVIDAVILPPQ
jgi:uncharacterized surface protein with fasciclin (FAS1) repeats